MGISDVFRTLEQMLRAVRTTRDCQDALQYYLDNRSIFLSDSSRQSVRSLSPVLMNYLQKFASDKSIGAGKLTVGPYPLVSKIPQYSFLFGGFKLGTYDCAVIYIEAANSAEDLGVIGMEQIGPDLPCKAIPL